MDRFVVTVNGGSSSLKLALFRAAAPPARVWSGQIERIGLPDPVLSTLDAATGATERRVVEAPTHAACVPLVGALVEARVSLDAVAGIGHRIVHGGPRAAVAAVVTPALLDELRALIPLDPDHMPAEVELIEAFAARHPRVPQVACFDTAFHHALPRVAALLPIPRRYEARGVRRYGFHGLSYGFLLKALARRVDPAAARGRIVLAHLGNGASLAAVREGRPIDTSMALTPAAGVMMSTRSGDLDPGLVAHLARTEGMTPERFDRMVHAESGLLGVSETSSDVRDLLACEATDPRAADALALFCYQVKKCIGAFAAALGGLDALVFAGGIGENAPAIRRRVCDGLEFLGVALDAARNDAGETVISASGGRVTVCVLRTDEESAIAGAVCATLGLAEDAA